MAGQWQGSEGFKIGNPKRELETIPLFNLDPTTPPGEIVNVKRLFLTNLVGNLKLHIAVGIVQDNSSRVFPWPAGGGTVQITPFNQFGDTVGKNFLRPIFQDPTNVTNTDAPLAQELPFGWEGSFTEASGMLIEVTITPGVWTGIGLAGTIVCQVTVEYNGAWWDVAAFTYALSRPQLTGDANPVTLGTGGGG